MISSEDLSKYFEGKKIYGDDFTNEEIKSWFRDEGEAYASLVKDREKYTYHYHSLNWEFGFRFLPASLSYRHVLGFGSAYGHELIPIIDRIDRITIVEPSEEFANSSIEGVPVTYIKPNYTGDLQFESNYFHLITCFGVLHHIPNVTKVVNELYRCLVPGGYALLREPINSMGNWTLPRKGLTKRERGLPLPIFRQIIISSGFHIVKENKYGHYITKQFIAKINKTSSHNNNSIYSSPFVMRIDKFLSKYLYINRQYHPIKRHRGPKVSGVFYVLSKGPS